MGKFNCEDETLYLFTVTDPNGTAYRVAGRLCEIAEGLPDVLRERYDVDNAEYAVLLEDADEEEALEAGVPVGGTFWRLYDGETVSATPPTVTWSRVCEWLLSVFDVPDAWLTSEELPLFEVK